MSAIATVLAAMGHAVSGSDLQDLAGDRTAPAAGIDGGRRARLRRTWGSRAGDHVHGHPGRQSRGGRGPTDGASRCRPGRDVLAAIAALRRCIAIAGTHGKTTTASMLALILVEAGLRPSFLIGGDVNEIGTNAVWDAGEWFVVEADESDGTFLPLVPEIAVVTNVEPDHLDHYGSFEALRAAFGTFLQAARRSVVAGADDAEAARTGRARAPRPSAWGTTAAIAWPI